MCCTRGLASKLHLLNTLCDSGVAACVCLLLVLVSSAAMNDFPHEAKRFEVCGTA